MKLSLNWLKDYVDIDMSPEELAHMLTMTGLEVEGVEILGLIREGIVIAEILSIKKHPRADRLFLCRMDTGRDNVQVVCGAPNLKVGDLVPMALPGARLPNGVKVKKGRIRGEESMGMLLAEDELGLTHDHSGIMILPEGLEKGIELSSAVPLEDRVFDISLTPNRPDCASVIGIAREVAALTGQKVRMPEIVTADTGPPIEDLAAVEIEDIKGCPRYAAGMIQGVDLRPSPFWMRYRLHAAGVRAINNVVDISNYVLMEMGQPLHTFDYDMLKRNRIVVKRAKDGDQFTTLDGQIRTLNGEHLMICDGERPVALAGIMGGLNSEISDDSRDILIESACFDPITIRRGARNLGLSTEASYRFERGIDIGGIERALKRSLSLMADLAGGTINKGIIDVYPKPYDPPLIDLRVKKSNVFLGTSITKDKMVSYMKALEMEVIEKDNDTIQAKPPTFRVDISCEADLVEEVARLEGYDNIPVTYPSIRPADEAGLPVISLRNQVSEIMCGMGFSEIITYSFVSPDSADLIGVKDESPLRSFVKLLNPLTVDQSVMRTSLIPSMLETVRDNISRGEPDLKLFEWGKIFIHDDSSELPFERLFLAGIITGLYRPKEWHNRERIADFYDIKGAVETLLGSLGLKDVIFERDEPEPGYHPDRSCRLYLKDRVIGNLGQVDPDIIDRYDIKTDSAFLFEIDIEALLENISGHLIKFEPFAKFPAVVRDLSIIVDKGIESGPILDSIKAQGGELVESVNVISLYEGEKIGPAKKSVSFRICYRSRAGTLDSGTVNRLHEGIIDRIREETGGTLSEG